MGVFVKESEGGCFRCGSEEIEAKLVNTETKEILQLCRTHRDEVYEALHWDGQSIVPSFSEWTVLFKIEDHGYFALYGEEVPEDLKERIDNPVMN